jgi:hypothetical protein
MANGKMGYKFTTAVVPVDAVLIVVTSTGRRHRCPPLPPPPSMPTFPPPSPSMPHHCHCSADPIAKATTNATAATAGAALPLRCRHTAAAMLPPPLLPCCRHCQAATATAKLPPPLPSCRRAAAATAALLPSPMPRCHRCRCHTASKLPPPLPPPLSSFSFFVIAVIVAVSIAVAATNIRSSQQDNIDGTARPVLLCPSS